MYVRNASGLVRDGAKLLHILVILFLVIYLSNRNIINVVIIQHSSKGYGSLDIMSRNICMKATTTVLTEKFIISAYVNGFLYDLGLTFCYLIALKSRYKQIFWMFSILLTFDNLWRKRYAIQKRFKNVMGLGLTYIYALVLTQFSFPIHGLKMITLQTYKEDFGVEKIFEIWWHGNVIELLCRF